MFHPNTHGQWSNALGRQWLRRRLVFALKPATGLTLPGLGKRHLFRSCDSVIRSHRSDKIWRDKIPGSGDADRFFCGWVA